MSSLAQILSKSPLSNDDAKWLSILNLSYLDAGGIKRRCETVERRTRPTGSDADSVVILPILVSQDEVKTILITQFRPPVSTYTVELPAGLIDENETAEEAAIRELKEETGYVADSERCVSLGGILANFAEMTRDTMRFVVCVVDLSDPRNRDGVRRQELTEDEDIELHVVALDQMPVKMEELVKKGCVPDAFLGSFSEAIGLVPWLLEMGLR